MGRKTREFTTFSLSFLDIMCCGFGATLLIFLLMNHAVDARISDANQDLMSEVDLLEEDVTDGDAGLVKLRNTIAELDQKMAQAQGLATRISEEKEQAEAQIKDRQREGYTDNNQIEALKSELLALEEKVKELRASSKDTTGTKARAFIGEGNRQYLTGLKLGGQNVAILLDTSASMLADRLVQIIRLRNMDEAVQRRAEKWTRALDTVDWLTAQLPTGSKYQVITFNTQAKVALPGTEGKWLEVANQAQVSEMGAALRKLTPTGGTSLENAVQVLRSLSPQPDNIFLITDGLPTQGASAPRGSKVSGPERQKLFGQAVRLLPRQVPVNIILAPMEGDPMAAAEFWQLAMATHGSMLMPARDWP